MIKEKHPAVRKANDKYYYRSFLKVEPEDLTTFFMLERLRFHALWGCRCIGTLQFNRYFAGVMRRLGYQKIDFQNLNEVLSTIEIDFGIGTSYRPQLRVLRKQEAVGHGKLYRRRMKKSA